MDFEKVKNRIKKYTTTYYSELRNHMKRYELMQEAFPDFLIGSKLVQIIIGQDGVVICHYESKADQFNFSVDNRTVKKIVTALSNGVFTFDYPPESMFDLETAELAIHEGEDTSGPIVWQAPWHRIQISSKLNAARWSEELARTQASNDVLTFVTAHLMELQHPKPSEVFGKLERIIKEFEQLLDKNPREELVQQFLTDNPVLLAPNAVRIIPKHRLGGEFITDFVVELAEKEYILVEIEAPSQKLFTQNGDPAAALSHAQRQVEDWRQWVHENIAYARNCLPGINDPGCMVIIGRSNTLSERDKKALIRKNAELNHIKISTYDDLLESAKRYLENLRQL